MHSHPMHSNIMFSLFSETVEVCDIKSIELNAYILSGINIEWLRMEGLIVGYLTTRFQLQWLFNV